MRAMKELGTNVVMMPATGALSRSSIDVLREMDVVHAFNLTLAHQWRKILEEAKRARVAAALSPIFWDPSDYEERGGGVPPWKRMVLKAMSPIESGIPDPVFGNRFKSFKYNARYRKLLAVALEQADLLLPNSEAELRLLRSSFPCNGLMRVVRNACRAGHGAAPPSGNIPDRFILCVGRIERRKNQLSLIRAMNGMGLPLVLAGGLNPSERNYARDCRREARALRIRLVETGELAWKDLQPLYSSALAHVQPSWYETPGLSSLEAAAAGCPVVCTRVGSAQEYFGGLASYCDPSAAASIRAALLSALETPPPKSRLIERMRAFSWIKAAKETLDAYRELLHGAFRTETCGVAAE